MKRKLAACVCVWRRNVSVWSMGVCNSYYVRGVQRLQLTMHPAFSDSVHPGPPILTLLSTRHGTTLR